MWSSVLVDPRPSKSDLADKFFEAEFSVLDSELPFFCYSRAQSWAKLVGAQWGADLFRASLISGSV